MSIRPAIFSDQPKLIELVNDMYRRSKYRDLDQVDDKQVRSILAHSIRFHGVQRAGGACIYVAVNGDQLEGFIIGVLDRVYHIGTKLEASDLFYYCREGASPTNAIGLFNTFLEWASENKDVITIRCGATDAIGDYHKMIPLFARKGFQQTGVIFERGNQP